jgi:two-component system response regulator HydG
MAATNVDLRDAINSKRFRADLFYRLNVISLHLPPLRERTDDLPELIDALLRKVLRRSRHSISGITPAARVRLCEYSWPGNVRELENALEHACAVATEAEIDVGDLPDADRSNPVNVPIATADSIRPLWQVERDYILAVIRLCKGNKTRAAQALRIAQDTLYRKLKQYRESA